MVHVCSERCLTDATRICVFALIEQNPDGMDQREIARHIGLTASRVQQLEQEILRRLFRVCRVRGLERSSESATNFGAPQRRYGGAL